MRMSVLINYGQWFLTALTKTRHGMTVNFLPFSELPVHEVDSHLTALPLGTILMPLRKDFLVESVTSTTMLTTVA